jgi:hypothetical protein
MQQNVYAFNFKAGATSQSLDCPKSGSVFRVRFRVFDTRVAGDCHGGGAIFLNLTNPGAVFVSVPMIFHAATAQSFYGSRTSERQE